MLEFNNIQFFFFETKEEFCFGRFMFSRMEIFCGIEVDPFVDYIVCFDIFIGLLEETLLLKL